MFLTFFKLDFCFELFYSQNTITFGGGNLEKYYFLDLKESVIGKQVHLSNLGGKKESIHISISISILITQHNTVVFIY